MNINATLLGQIITFAIFVWFTLKFVWPLLYKALEARKKKISDGLQAAEQGHRDLELAAHKTKAMLEEAQQEIGHALTQSRSEANLILQQAKRKALAVSQQERDMLLKEIKQRRQQLKTQLNAETASLVVDCAEKFLRKKFDEKTDKVLINKIIAEISNT
jgi:F-type H+-transporting ATPase subunit b